ncbi:MAG: BamA/TamA family outer membrane protein [Nannocystaceae bacterium]
MGHKNIVPWRLRRGRGRTRASRLVALLVALFTLTGLLPPALAAPPPTNTASPDPPPAPLDDDAPAEAPPRQPLVEDGEVSPAKAPVVDPRDMVEPADVDESADSLREIARDAADVPMEAADDGSTLGDRCARGDETTDPLAPIDNVLDRLSDAGFQVGRRDSSVTIRGRACATSIDGSAQGGELPPDQGLLQYVFEKAAVEGFVIVLLPRGSLRFDVLARPSLSGEERGLILADVDKISIDGTYFGGDSSARLEEILGLAPGTSSPTWIAAKLQQLGYRSEFYPVGAGEIVVQVAPGRNIRRVRVHNNVPLSRRDLQRELSIAARPGALAYGACVEPKKIRGGRKGAPLPQLCDDDDLACKAWEADEVTRIDRFLFDRGYLRGHARLALVCGRARGEADLHIFVDKGQPFRVGRDDLTIKGNVPTQDQRWIRRTFLPRIRATPIPTRITRDHVESAVEKTEQRYAEPHGGILSTGTSQSVLELPYPDVQVRTSYQDLEPTEVPRRGDLPLTVDIDLGRGVRTAFLGDHSFSKKRLLGELSLFRRRESPSDQTAAREAANLRAFLQSKGYLLAKVKGTYEEFGANSPGQLYFVLDQGPKVSVRSIDLITGAGVPPEVAGDITREFARGRKTTRGGAFSEAAVIDDLGVLLGAYQERGYPCARAEVEVAFWREGLGQDGQRAFVDLPTILERPTTPAWAERDLDPAGLKALLEQPRARLYVRITVEPGPRVFTAPRAERVRYLEVPIPGDRDVSNLPLTTEGNWGTKRMLNRTPLRRDNDTRPGGIALTSALDRDAEAKIVENYQSSGFPLADAEVRWVYRNPTTMQEHVVPQARRLTDPDVGMCEAHRSGTAVEVDTEISVYEGRRGTFGDTLVRGNFKTRGWVIRRELEMKPGDEYSAVQVAESQSQIDRTGVASSITVTPYPVGCELDAPQDQCTVHHVVDVREAKDISMDLAYGFGLATLDPFYLFVRPSFPNLFGTAWDLDLEGHYGFNLEEVPSSFPFLGDCAGQRCYARFARASLVRQRILASPLNFQLSGQYQQRLTPARGEIVSAVGNLGITYVINRQLSTYFGYIIQQANISKDVVKPTVDADGYVVNRRDAIVSDRTGALQTGITFTNVEDNPFNPEDGFIATADFMLASPYLGGLDWWFRAETSWQHFIPIPRTDNRLAFRYALRYGHAIPISRLPGASTTSIPEIWRYFGGGTVDLGLRGIAPETMLVDVEVLDQGSGVQRLSYTAQGGHIRAIGSIALEVVSVRDFLGGKLKHSLFFDFGVLTQKWQQVQWARDFRRSVGVNFLKWDIRLLTLSLGYAVLVPNAIAPGNVHATDDRNGRFVFDVGITF